MATNEKKSGEILTTTVSRTLSSGDGYLDGSLFGVAMTDIASGDEGELKNKGIFTLPKTSAQAWTRGDVINWDDTLHVCTTAAADAVIGTAADDAANPSSTGDVRLNSCYQPAVDATLIRYASVSLTNAEIKGLRAAPKTLVSAPGAGKVIEFVSAVLFLDYGTNVLTESADNLAVKYTDGSGAAVSQAIEATGFIDATADTMTNALAKIDTIVAKSASENKAIVLHNTGDGEYGGNAGVDTLMRVKVAYRVHTTGF
jgi:predicted RecA/RadA family phage recombinase